MTNQSTLDKLMEMHMTPMAAAFRIQMDAPSMKEFLSRTGSACSLMLNTLPAKTTD